MARERVKRVRRADPEPTVVEGSVITPSRTVNGFTEGKPYIVEKVYGFKDSLGRIRSDSGFTKVVSVRELGKRCPHLWDGEKWSEAGHWRQIG
jgi:hypothetical protein